MKKVLFRKLLNDYLSFFFIALISTSLVIWVFQAVNYLDIMIEDGRDYLVYINYTLLNFPKIISKVFPFALFFSVFYVTTKSELNNELIIFWNFGVHKIKIINFIIKISLILLILQIFLTAFLVPKCQDLARSFIRSSTVNFLDNFIKPQKFNDTIKGVTIYSDKKDKSENLINLYLKKVINGDEFQITYAKKGKFKQIGATPILVLSDGATITSKKGEITNISFSKSDFSLSNLKTNTTTYKKTQEISSFNLIKCIQNFYKLKKEIFEKKITTENCTYRNIENIIKEFYKRFIIPLYIPLLSLIPLLLITSSKENSNYNKLRTIIFLLGFGVIIFSEVTIRFISTKVSIYDLVMITAPLLSILILYLFFLNKFNIGIKK